MINFEGQGVISYRFKMKKMKILKDVISLKFKTTASNGVLLHGEGQQGDYISLELKRSKLLLMINLGNGPFPILSMVYLCASKMAPYSIFSPLLLTKCSARYKELGAFRDAHLVYYNR